MIERRVEEALKAYRNREPTSKNGDGHGDDNINDNGNANKDRGRNDSGNGLGGGNGNGNPNVNVGGVVTAAIRTDDAYAMTWKELMTLVTKVFQELVLLCTKIVLEEKGQVEKFIGGLLDNIQGNVIAAEPTRLQDNVRITNNLLDQKLKGYAARNAENKRIFNNKSRDNIVQQPPFKR
nr:hypothetical protein [Tanacetum cinerariifolium]